YFWHITDLHFDPAYSTKGDVLRSCWYSEHHQSSSRSVPGRFGDYSCDSPWALLESATQAMRSRQGDNVEFVLWTGDGLSHSTRRSLESHRLDLLRNITELLGRTFSAQFVFPGCLVMRTVKTEISIVLLWRHWLPLEALQTFEKGGYYTIEQTKSQLRIIVLNTNFMRHDLKYTQSHSAAIRQRPGSSNGDSSEHTNYYYNHGNYYHGSNNGYYAAVPATDTGGQTRALSGVESHESQRQWEWLEAVLAKSNRNKETVYIVGHMPPGSDERQVGNGPNGHSTFSEKNNLKYLRLVRKYSSIIQGQFFGHLHSDSFRIVYNDIGKPVSWIMIAPSVTPRKMNVGANNPGMRLYKFETDTGQVLDYTQYYLDLEQANSALEATWQAEYNLTTQYYGLAEVTSVALHNLADRFTNAEDPLLAKYYRANSVRYVSNQCDGACALNHYCAITRLDYSRFRECLESAASALASRAQTAQRPLLVLLLPLLLALRQRRHYLQSLLWALQPPASATHRLPRRDGHPSVSLKCLEVVLYIFSWVVGSSSRARCHPSGCQRDIVSTVDSVFEETSSVCDKSTTVIKSLSTSLYPQQASLHSPRVPTAAPKRFMLQNIVEFGSHESKTQTQI
uniref:Putative acid sphingomyelinase-like phosphodiesterase 3b n=1 Tax=Lutzomyia longipalpis TaxID=7200 RepID=A0A1B0CM43_LUTLO